MTFDYILNLLGLQADDPKFDNVDIDLFLAFVDMVSAKYSGCRYRQEIIDNFIRHFNHVGFDKLPTDSSTIRANSMSIGGASVSGEVVGVQNTFWSISGGSPYSYLVDEYIKKCAASGAFLYVNYGCR